MFHVCTDSPPLSIGPVTWSFVSWLVIGTINPEHAFNTPNDTANGCADNGAHGTGAAIALICTMSDAAGNSLRLGSDRHRDDCNDRGRN
jgi:hypothetical protein